MQRMVIRFMRTQHDWSVIDFGRGVNPLLASAAEELDELFLMTTIDIPSLHMAKSMLRTLPGAFERVPVRLVLNRMQKSLGVSGWTRSRRFFGRLVALRPSPTISSRFVYGVCRKWRAALRTRRHAERQLRADGDVQLTGEREAKPTQSSGRNSVPLVNDNPCRRHATSSMNFARYAREWNSYRHRYRRSSCGRP